MKKLNQSLALVTLSLGLIGQNSVSAAIINSTFSGTADFGPLIGQSYSGSATFDNFSITGVGDETVPTSQFEVTFNGQTFNNGNAQAGNSAKAVFVDGVFAGIQYVSQIVMNLSVALVAGFVDTSDASFTYNLSGTDGSGPITYSVSTPEPSLILGLLAVGGIGMLKKRS